AAGTVVGGEFDGADERPFPQPALDSAERQRDKGTRRRGDKEKGRQEDKETRGFEFLVSLSPLLLVPLSPCFSIPIPHVLSVARVVIHSAVARLLRRREEREQVAERHVVRVDVVAQGVLIGHEEEDRVNRIVSQASSVRETGASIVTAAGAAVGLV